MSYLIFCSFEVGGLPYKMAEILNRHGVEAYYISFARNAHDDYNSTEFHYGRRREDWNLSSLFDRKRKAFRDIKLIRDLKSKHGIKCSFATGSKAYLLGRAGLNYKYWSYGSDLDLYGKFSIFSIGFPIWKKAVLYPYFLFTYFREQKESILKAGSIMLSSYQMDAYQKLCPGKPLFFLSHIVNIIEYKELCKKKEESKKVVCRDLGAENFFFSSARHLWFGKNRLFSDNKGNDIVLRSFARYLEKSGNESSKLILIERGQDVERSKKLIQELGVSKYVIWINEKRREDLWIYYRGASICFGQFGVPVLNYVAIEPLSNGTPSVSFVGNNNMHVPFYNTMPPILNSKSIEEISDFMLRIVSDEEYASNLFYNSWLWAKENCSEERFVDTFLNEMRR